MKYIIICILLKRLQTEVQNLSKAMWWEIVEMGYDPN